MRFGKKGCELFIAPAVALAFTAPVYGSDANNPQSASSPASAASAAAESRAAAGDVRAGQLIGMEVRDRSGEEIGEIEDAVIDLSDGKVRRVVLSRGGFLDVGDTHYVYGLDQFSKAPQDEHLVLNAGADSVRTAPNFEAGAWPSFDDSVWEITGGAETDLRRMSELIGIKARSASGVQIGEVQDFTIELSSGSAHAVLAYDPGENAEERLVAISPARLGIPKDSEVAVVNMTRSELMKAPRVTDMQS
ncbi:MAG: PRC-barrel domain-containing protein [Betaproteobacteria bacterium]